MINIRRFEEMMKQVGYITEDDLMDAFPALYSAFKKVVGGKKPTITLYTTDAYTFSGASFEYSKRTEILYQHGKTVTLSGEYGGPQVWAKPNVVDSGQTVPIKEGEALLSLDIGAGRVLASLYVHPSYMNKKAIQNDTTDLSEAEKFALVCVATLTSSGRKREWDDLFRSIKYGGTPYGPSMKLDMNKVIAEIKTKKWGSLIKDIPVNIFKSLEGKGFVKVSSNGAVAATISGKNEAMKFK